MVPIQPSLELLWAPRRVRLPRLDQNLAHRLARSVRDPSRGTALVIQTVDAELLVTLLDSVACVPTDPELPAQIRQAFSLFQPEHELHSLVHATRLFPGHWQPPASAYQVTVSAMCPVQSVRYVPGSDPGMA